jgi:uncharacterized protein YvpB
VSFVKFKSIFRKLFSKNHVFIGELSLLLIIGIMIGLNACAKSNNQKESSSSEPCVAVSSEKSESIIEDTVKSEIPVVNKEKKETKKTKAVEKKTSLTANEIKKIKTVVAARNAIPKASGKPYGNATVPKTTAVIGSAKTIPMKCILQNPELPTGCEATSLTMVLNYFGYNVSKATIAGEYLPQSTNFYVSNGRRYGPDCATTFPGNPFTEYGYGCLAPAIVTTANNYLSAYGNGHTTVSNISGSSPTQLYDYVKKGIPVIVWATMGMQKPYQGDNWYTPSGKLIQWTSREHCLVLVGYNNNSAILNDPLVGRAVSYPRQTFETRYAQMGSQAVVITDNSTPSSSSSSSASTGSTPSRSSSSSSTANSTPSSSSSSSSSSNKASSCSTSSSSSSSDS